MKNNRAKAMPHPVLSPFSSDVEPPVFELLLEDQDITCDMTMWTLRGRVKHENAGLSALVRGGRAKFGLHVECPRTFYRNWFSFQDERVEARIPADRLWGRVELSAFCVAEKDIKAYEIAGQHPDYGDSTFYVSQGDVLAFAQTKVFDAYPDIDPILKVSSILDIRKDPKRKSGQAHIDFDGQKIAVELAQDDYLRYAEMRSDSDIRGALASNVVFPAILQSANYLLKLEPDQREEASSDKRWCRSLWARLEKAGLRQAAEPEKVFVVVQDVLRLPISRGLNDLFRQTAGET